MMRIKYRVYEPKYKTFYYWGYIRDGCFTGIPSTNILNVDYCREHSDQYTGINDSDGKEIYENDIIEFKSGHWEEDTLYIYYNERALVEWNNTNSGGYPMLAHTMCDGSYAAKVIGNIHDNPDLVNSSGNVKKCKRCKIKSNKKQCNKVLGHDGKHKYVDIIDIIPKIPDLSDDETEEE